MDRNLRLIFGGPDKAEQDANDLNAGFKDGVGIAFRLVQLLADETTDKSPAYIEGLFLALREEI